MKTLSFAASFAAMLVLVSCASNVPPPEDEDAEAWTPGIQSSYPDWQPPEEMPEGNPAYAEAFGEPRPVDGKDNAPAVVAADEKTSASDPVKKVDETPEASKPKQQAQVQEVKPQPVETKPAAPAKFMRVDVFPVEAGVDGVYAVNGERVNSAALKSALNETGKTNKDIAVILFGRPRSAESDMNAAIDWCKAAGIKKINVMTNDDIMAQRKAEVRAAKGQKDDAAASSAKAEKPAREKLVVDTDKPATDYVVKDGDTLSSLAKTFYHDGAEWEIIFDANKETLNGKPNFLKIGTKLVIPAVKKVTVSPK
ncbi:MAG: LysM peptidoglycan-binding domain-containing protein [Lentisphaeria bacterium]|nr:LysM peptidoglycan-binding domain-containing protein [Lentisphaeria bacterium]